jgi:hypothetical protein
VGLIIGGAIKLKFGLLFIRKQVTYALDELLSKRHNGETFTPHLVLIVITGFAISHEEHWRRAELALSGVVAVAPLATNPDYFDENADRCLEHN